MRQVDRPVLRQEQKVVVGDRRSEGMIRILAPVGQKRIDADGIDHRARKNMRADLGTLFQHYDGKIGVDLLETDRCAQASSPAAHDNNVEFHAFAFDLFTQD